MNNIKETLAERETRFRHIRGKGRKMIVISAAALLIAAFLMLIFGNSSGAAQKMMISRIDIASMTLFAKDNDAEEHGLQVQENTVIQDVNGQIIDFSELTEGDFIRVQFVGNDFDIKTITLLPEGSDEYI